MNRMTRLFSFRIGLAGLTALFTIAAVGFVGCQEPGSRLNAPPQGATERPHDQQANYTHMTDNALLEEMSMSDCHFVPHTCELNSLGVRRAKRYAEILKVYGGTLRYDGLSDTDEMASARVDAIRNILIAEGMAGEDVAVQVAVAGGTDMDAGEAAVIRQDSRYKVGQNEKKGQEPPLGSSGSGKQ